MCLSRGGTVLKKLFLDFSLGGAAVNPYMGCRWSKLHFCRSDWLDASRRMLGEAIPAKLYTLLTLSLLLGLPCPGTVFLYPSGTVVSKNALFSLFSVFFKQFVIVAGKKHAL